MNQFSIAFQSIINGITGIGKYKLLRYIFLSGLIALALLIVLAILSWFFGGILGDTLVNIIPWVGDHDGSTGKWLGRVLSFALGVILFKYLILITTGPLMSKVSEKIESFYVPDLPHLNINLVQSVNRGIKFSLRSLFFELLLTIIVSLLGLIPILTIFSIPLLFIVQSYFAGAGLMDLTLERFYRISGSVKFIRSHIILSIIYGAIFLGILFIPILGLFISPVFGTAISSYGVLNVLKTK
jgi:CysZ protein